MKVGSRSIPIAVSALLVCSAAHGAGAPALSDRLEGIRGRVLTLERGLIDGLKQQKASRSNLKKIQTLLKLQREERTLGRQRLEELERTVTELEMRRGELKERILQQQRSVRRRLVDIGRSMGEQPRSLKLFEREQIEAPRRKALSLLADRGIKEVEAYRADLADADRLEARIQDERSRLAYVFQDLKEQEGVLELNRQLQVDLVKERHHERAAQLENYRMLKGAEAQVERLIRDFNSRRELEKVAQEERDQARKQHDFDLAVRDSPFALAKGKLPLPIAGKVISFFGRALDPKSNLQIFKKGIDIETAKEQPVLSVFAGKVAYSGELPNYGRLTIVDHGDHFYTLCAKLGALSKKAGDVVAAGEPIGTSDADGTPVYFEIRSRNIAVNPLQWVFN